MGKGDRKTKRGKRIKGSYGVRRPKKKKNVIPEAATKKKARKAAAKPKAASPKAAATKPKTAPKKTAKKE